MKICFLEGGQAGDVRVLKYHMEIAMQKKVTGDFYDYRNKDKDSNLGERIKFMLPASRLEVRIPRFGRISCYMRDFLHWFPTHNALSTASLPWFCVA